MKKILFAVAIMSSFLVKAQDNNAPLSDIELKKGLHLVYSVSQGEKAYQYIVDFVSVTDSAVVFNWSMTEPINKSGVITLTAKALKEGQYLHFYPSTITYDNKDICMLLGTDIFKNIASIQKKDSYTMSCDACFREVTVEAIEKFNYFGKDGSNTDVQMSAISFASIYNNGTFTVLNNPKFPLILYFSFNMTIAFKSFSYN